MADTRATGVEIGQPQPRLARVVLGFVLAPMLGVLALVLWLFGSALWAQGQQLTYALPGITVMAVAAAGIAAVTTLVLGLPTYLILRRRVRFTLLSVTLIGGLVAVAGAFLLALVLPEGENLGRSLGFALTFFVFGCVGGFTFWLCAFWRDPSFSRVQRP